MKKVINNIYETKKMRVELLDNAVLKTFKQKPKDRSNTRYQREKKALHLLKGETYFPKLLDFDDEKQMLKMSRLQGEQAQKLSIEQIEILRKMVDKMLNLGVARHAIPLRDLIAKDENELGMVDFERITFRNFALSPVWLIAKQISKYHLYRLIYEHQPSMLKTQEKILFFAVNGIRALLQPLKPLRQKLKSSFKNSSKALCDILDKA